MERRAFLKMVAIGGGVGLTTTLLPNSRVEAATVEPSVSASWASLLFDGLAWFAEKVAAPIIVDVASSWLSSKINDADGQAGKSAIDELDTKGYLPQQYSPVYQCQTNQTPFFGCAGGGNTFVPFVYPTGDGGYAYTYFGGAAILGLSDYTSDVASRYSRAISNGSMSPADYFVPTGSVSTCDCMFSPYHPWAANYPTNRGVVQLQYTPPFRVWNSYYRRYFFYNGKIDMFTKDSYGYQNILYPYTRAIGYNEVFA